MKSSRIRALSALVSNTESSAMMSSFPVGGTASGINSPADFELRLPENDLKGDWDFLNNAYKTGQTDFDSFSDLFEGEGNNETMAVEMASGQDANLFRTYSADGFAQGNSSYSQTTTQLASPQPDVAVDKLPPNSAKTTSHPQSPPEITSQLKDGFATMPSTQGFPERGHDELTEQRVLNSNDGPSRDISSSPRQTIGSRHPSASVSFAAPQTICGRPATFLPSQSDILFPPGNYDGRQRLSTSASTIDADKDAPYEVTLQSTQTATPSKPTTPSQTGWEPFTDVRQGRIWVFGGENGQSQASLQDETFPRTPAQRRLVADGLRAAFESVEPPKNKHEFLLLDWTCLELVDEVSLAHAYGPLTKRYLSGMPKLGPAQYNKYSDHTNDLIAVISRQDCPRAKSLRKRMMDVSHRKRLIDNPWGELGIVAKNGDANKARRLREEERKANATALERENALLKAQLEGRSPAAAPGLYQTNNGRNSKPSPRSLITPRRPSSKLSSAQRSITIQQPSRTSSDGSAFTADNSSTSFSEQPPPTFFGFSEDEYEPTLTDTHGPCAPKKARHTAYTSMARPQTPTPNARSDFHSRQGGRFLPAPESISLSQIPITSAPVVAAPENEPLPLSSDAVQATALFEHHRSLVLAGLSADHVIEAGRLGLELNEYAYIATLQMYGLQ